MKKTTNEVGVSKDLHGQSVLRVPPELINETPSTHESKESETLCQQLMGSPILTEYSKSFVILYSDDTELSKMKETNLIDKFLISLQEDIEENGDCIRRYPGIKFIWDTNLENLIGVLKKEED